MAKIDVQLQDQVGTLGDEIQFYSTFAAPPLLAFQSTNIDEVYYYYYYYYCYYYCYYYFIIIIFIITIIIMIITLI